MKAINLVTALSVAVCLAVASGAHAQSSDAAGTATAPAAMTRSAQRKADHKLDIAVRHALSRTRDVDVSDIAVRARGDVVTLTGTVPDVAQIARAGQVAAGVPGVMSVSNRIILGTGQ